MEAISYLAEDRRRLAAMSEQALQRATEYHLPGNATLIEESVARVRAESRTTPRQDTAGSALASSS
jgi:hypothetical protein